MYGTHCVWYYVWYTLYHCIWYTLCIVLCMVYIVSLYMVLCMVYIAYGIVYGIHCIWYVSHCIGYTLWYVWHWYALWYVWHCIWYTFCGGNVQKKNLGNVSLKSLEVIRWGQPERDSERNTYCMSSLYTVPDRYWLSTMPCLSRDISEHGAHYMFFSTPFLSTALEVIHSRAHLKCSQWAHAQAPTLTRTHTRRPQNL